MKEITFRKRDPAGCPQYGDYSIRERSIGRDVYGHERYEYALFRLQHFEFVRQFRTRKQSYQYLCELTFLSRWDIQRGSSSIICHDHQYLGVIYGNTLYRITKRTRVLEKRPVEDERLTRWYDRYADCLAEAKRLLEEEA